MNLYRRFVRWLARKDLAAVTVKCIEAQAEAAVFVERSSEAVNKMTETSSQIVAQAEIIRRMAFAEGQLFGRQELSDEIDRVISARTMGFGDYISAEDLARARKGLLH